MRSWHGKHIHWQEGQPSTLYLSDNFKEACEYAYEVAAIDEGDGYRPQPVVYAIHLSDLQAAKLEFGPDYGWLDSTGKTWLQSLAEVKGFTVAGDIERLKKQRKFRRIFCPRWDAKRGVMLYT